MKRTGWRRSCWIGLIAFQVSFCLVPSITSVHAKAIVLTGIIVNDQPSAVSAYSGILAVKEEPLALLAESFASALASSCLSVEYGDTQPFPISVINLDEDLFFTIVGKAPWVPPAPGSAGDITIAGVDADEDCVRDDAERYIAKLFKGKDDKRKRKRKRKRKYLFEYAKYLGQFLNPLLSRSGAQSISANLYISAECVYQIHGDNRNTKDLLDDVFSNFHNTYSRSERYNHNNVLLGRWTTRENFNVSCP